MTGYGYNMLSNSNLSFPVNSEKNSNLSFDFKLPIHRIDNHDMYQYYYDKNHPNVKPLSLFLSGSYYLIKNLENNYDEIVMIGLSGGGWQTTILTALLPKIQKAYSFYGDEFPANFKFYRPINDHWELSYSKIYQEYDYWNFWTLALLDSENLYTREYYLITNQPGYNGKIYEKLENVVNFTSLENFKIIFLDKEEHYHGVDIDFFEKYTFQK